MVISPKRILWPTDFSSLSELGARYTRGFCDTFQAALHVVHVVPPMFTPDMSVTLPTEVPLAYSEDELVQACRRRLAEVITQHFGDLTDVTSEVFFGNAWSGICKYAEENAIDLIVISTHGRTGLQHVLIGSTAERIVQHAPCSVLVAKSTEQDSVSD